MHIPDGFIDLPTSLGAGAAAAGGLGVSLRRAGRYLKEKQVPLAGLLAAFVFALQMLNFPVAAGTSGHLLGGALAAVLVGPWVGALVVTVVVVIQALLFADGGVSALGLNVLNMALVATWVAYPIFLGVRRLGAAVVPASFVAGLVSVEAASLGFVLEYALGGTGNAPVGTVAAAVAGIHLLIGIGEGLITALVVGAVLRTRADLVQGARPVRTRRPS